MPWDETDNEIRQPIKDAALFQKDSFRTKEITEGVSVVLGKLKDGDGSMIVQSYRFSKDKFTLEQAQEWFAEHVKDALAEKRTLSMEYLESVLRLAREYISASKWEDFHKRARSIAGGRSRWIGGGRRIEKEDIDEAIIMEAHREIEGAGRIKNIEWIESANDLFSIFAVDDGLMKRIFVSDGVSAALVAASVESGKDSGAFFSYVDGDGFSLLDSLKKAKGNSLGDTLKSIDWTPLFFDRWPLRYDSDLIKAEFTIKAAGEQQIAYGIVLEPEKVMLPAADGFTDVVDAEVIEKAAHNYLSESRKIRLAHDQMTEEIDVVESYIAPVDFTFDNGVKVKKGTWIMAIHIKNGMIWKDVKAGKYQAFSVGGGADREIVFS